MVQPIVMPKPGQMTESCTVLKWLKKEGDAVAKGDVLLEIETDKAAMEVESFTAGTLLKILVKEGQTAAVQTVIGFVGTPGEALPAVAAPPPPPAATAAAPVKKSAAAVAAPIAAAPVPAPAAAVFKISPRAARLANASVIDPTPIRGTGEGGRVTEKDVQAYLDSKGYAALRVTPAAKELAAKESIDLLSLKSDGRIGIEEVRRALAERPKPMSRMRQVIAQRLTASVTTAPHFFVTVSVDMTELGALRTELKKKGAAPSFNDFVLRAVALALKEFPEVNSTTDGRTIRWNSRIHLGLAVNIEGGLVVPVIRDAGDLTPAELHDRAAGLAERARQGKLLPDEMSGGTFTISNMGMLGVENFTAIINPGESAILAVSTILPQPVARNGAVVVRDMMKITLSADHRILDGAGAARFVNALKAKLEDTDAWKNSTS